jgi:hypothetical protein
VDVNNSRLATPNSERNTPEEYCRAIEAYLCRKNDGHLIRIVGPSFEKVCSWAEQGVPIKVAFRGIDRYFERYYGKGPRRRPVRIDFCEADVLDVFDEWRRAVGVAPSEAPRVRHESLPAHLDRLLTWLTRRNTMNPALDPVIHSIVHELESSRSTAKELRGAARAALLARLQQLDATLIGAARELLTDPELEQLRREAEGELAHYRGRMPPAAYEHAVAACIDRLLRDR